jgi:hypothetical protein
MAGRFARPFLIRRWSSLERVQEIDEIRLVLVAKADAETLVVEVDDIPQRIRRCEDIGAQQKSWIA